VVGSTSNVIVSPNSPRNLVSFDREISRVNFISQKPGFSARSWVKLVAPRNRVSFYRKISRCQLSQKPGFSNKPGFSTIETREFRLIYCGKITLILS
jgi:hypothetical protein